MPINAVLTQFSGWMNPSDASSGQVGSLPNNSVFSGSLASGQVSTLNVASGGLLSGAIGSGQIGRFHMASGCVIDYLMCEQMISGIIAVTWGSGGCFVVPAERGSGFRLPAIGVVAGNFTSGALVPVVRTGLVTTSLSGMIASGAGPANGEYLYVGSGGLIINQSGFMGGASSGQGAAPTAAGSGYSGCMVQRIGFPVSGGIDVNVGEITSGLLSGLLNVY